MYLCPLEKVSRDLWETIARRHLVLGTLIGKRYRWRKGCRLYLLLVVVFVQVSAAQPLKAVVWTFAACEASCLYLLRGAVSERERRQPGSLRLTSRQLPLPPPSYWHDLRSLASYILRYCCSGTSIPVLHVPYVAFPGLPRIRAVLPPPERD
jgi:hypothetical protein